MSDQVTAFLLTRRISYERYSESLEGHAYTDTMHVWFSVLHILAFKQFRLTLIAYWLIVNSHVLSQMSMIPNDVQARMHEIRYYIKK